MPVHSSDTKSSITVDDTKVALDEKMRQLRKTLKEKRSTAAAKNPVQLNDMGLPQDTGSAALPSRKATRLYEKKLQSKQKKDGQDIEDYEAAKQMILPKRLPKVNEGTAQGLSAEQKKKLKQEKHKLLKQQRKELSAVLKKAPLSIDSLPVSSDSTQNDTQTATDATSSLESQSVQYVRPRFTSRLAHLRTTNDQLSLAINS